MDNSELKILTWNLYLGGDHEPLFKVPPKELPAQMSKLWQMVQGTFFPSRARSIAAVIARSQADIVGLQEVTRWSIDGRPRLRTQQPLVVYDFISLLLGELAARGAYYTLVARSPGVDVLLPTTEGFDVHYEDAVAILVRVPAPGETLAWSNPRAERFGENIRAPLREQWLTLSRQWASVDVTAGGQSVRFINTHIEYVPSMGMAQCKELLKGPAEPSDRPVLLAGDFNDDAETCEIWKMLIKAKFADAYTQTGKRGEGATHGQAENLRNPTSLLKRRLDWLLYRGQAHALSATVVGADLGDRTPDGLWPSDHAGVLAHIHIGS